MLTINTTRAFSVGVNVVATGGVSVAAVVEMVVDGGAGIAIGLVAHTRDRTRSRGLLKSSNHGCDLTFFKIVQGCW